MRACTLSLAMVCVASDADHFPRRIPILKKDAKGVFYVLCVLVVFERRLSACQEWLERSEGHPQSGRVAKAERSCTGIAKDGVINFSSFGSEATKVSKIPKNNFRKFWRPFFFFLKKF